MLDLKQLSKVLLGAALQRDSWCRVIDQVSDCLDILDHAVSAIIVVDANGGLGFASPMSRGTLVCCDGLLETNSYIAAKHRFDYGNGPPQVNGLRVLNDEFNQIAA